MSGVPGLIGLLREYLGKDRADTFQEFLHRRTGLLRPPSYTDAGWNRFMQMCHEELCAVGSKPL
jgi:hypothetical protein